MRQNGLAWVLGVAAWVSASVVYGVVEPEVVETRVVRLHQTVTLSDIPGDSEQIRLWVPVPSDGAWQRVIDRRVLSAPGDWRIVTQDEGRGEFLYTELSRPADGAVSVEIECLVERSGVHFPIEAGVGGAATAIDKAFFAEELDPSAPLMEADARIRELTARICGTETDVSRNAIQLMQAVARMADHYSKDPTKPHCGRGAAGDCLENGGGCCTDLHSLFVAMSRARGIPARIQYGYRMLDTAAGRVVDPGYRCWVEVFVPEVGWVPNDIVASDNATDDQPMRWASLSPTRVWLWEGRSFELTPRAKAGPIDTMLCGWAEIDGRPVDPLPAPDGTPSKLSRTIRFDVVQTDRTAQTPVLPQ